MTDIKKIVHGSITCHAWNADGTKVALCPNNNEIHIYKKSGNNYSLESKLVEHDQLVTGIDWAPKSNRIVSCSQDRNAYVWTFKNNEWKPVLVILRINRAATHVKWSPEENKFAVASGAKCVSVCYFEEDNDWWVSKHIKKHKSTVLDLDWHPNNSLICTASSDFKCRIFSAYIKGVDKQAPNTPWGSLSNVAFGEMFAEIDTPLGWVQASKWSPSGNQVAFCAQDSTLYVADVSKGSPQVTYVRYRDLPFRDLLWINENSIVCVGHDCTPVLFQKKGGWQFVQKLDTGGGGGAGDGSSSSLQKGNSAFKMFQNKVDKGESTPTETKLNTKHQNCITWIIPYKKSASNVTQYSTSGLDGNLIIWNAPK
jgi:actin related protein 2/3 complex subunit 1A/1B